MVHIVCANNAEHDHDENADVTSKVKTEPTDTEMGITEYSVSGSYDGFDYADTKDIQDIPATGKSGNGNILPFIAVGAVVMMIIAGIALFLFLRKRA